MTSTALSIREAVALCAAWADRFAKQHGCRALVVKGSILESQGLRGPHESIDVDLLVDPAQFTSFAEALADAGWQPMAASTSAGIMAKHAVTVLHEKWPISIDVHHYFPGFLAEPQTVFDALWERRTTAVVASVEVNTLDPASHAALAALHYLRSPAPGIITNMLDPLADKARTVLGPDGLNDLTQIAGHTGAAHTLALFLEKTGAAPATDDPALAEAYREWELRTQAAPSASWFVDLGRQPLHTWPAVIWRALFLTDQEITDHFMRPGDTIFRARMRRLRKGIRNAPGALVFLIRFKFTHPRKRGDV